MQPSPHARRATLLREADIGHRTLPASPIAPDYCRDCVPISARVEAAVPKMTLASQRSKIQRQVQSLWDCRNIHAPENRGSSRVRTFPLPYSRQYPSGAILGTALLVIGLCLAGRAGAQTEPPAAALPTFPIASGWDLHGQATVVDQWHGSFHSPYQGANSFRRCLRTSGRFRAHCS